MNQDFNNDLLDKTPVQNKHAACGYVALFLLLQQLYRPNSAKQTSPA